MGILGEMGTNMNQVGEQMKCEVGTYHFASAERFEVLRHGVRIPLDSTAHERRNNDYKQSTINRYLTNEERLNPDDSRTNDSKGLMTHGRTQCLKENSQSRYGTPLFHETLTTWEEAANGGETPSLIQYSNVFIVAQRSTAMETTEIREAHAEFNLQKLS
uniref:Uncharacterized protein n=1 Tax=Steinernema glaseri TaxID=37863 RepID=A0A1I7Z3X5_9BILA